MTYVQLSRRIPFSTYSDSESEGAGVELGVGRRNIESIVGRRAAPKGVERKSAGRSILIVKWTPNGNTYDTNLLSKTELIHR